MAKAKKLLMNLVNSEEKTKTVYTIRVPTKGPKMGKKIELMKYDPVLRRHCKFTSKKLPNPKA